MDRDETKITIPVEYQELGSELAKLATRYRLSSMSVTMVPGYFDSRWDADIHFKWDQGRHDEDVGQFELRSEMRAFVRMEWDEIKESLEQRMAESGGGE